MGNIRNHLAADPSANIVVVTNGNGIEFLLEATRREEGLHLVATGPLTNVALALRVDPGFAGRLADARLLLPALEYALKCSHLFNLLDSSGSIGVTERTAYILRVRQLAVRLCREYAAGAEAAAAARAEVVG